MIDHRARTNAVPSHRRTRRAARTAAVLTAGALAASAGAQTSWDAPVSGSWLVGNNWDTMMVPSDMTDAVLGLSGAYTVSIDSGNAATGTLSITNPDATLGINVFRNLTMFGNVLNQGTIIVNPQGSASSAALTAGADLTLLGTGSLVLNNNNSGSQVVSPGGFTLTQDTGHTVRGFGLIQLAMVNNGLVSSDSAARIRFQSNALTNNAIVEAVGGSEVELNSAIVSQGPGGQIRADGAGSFVDIISSSITGGEVNATNDATIEIASGNATFDGVELNGTLNLRVFRLLDLASDLQNNGVLNVNPDGSASSATLRATGDVSLNGPGEVVLRSTTGGALITSNPGFVLTNTADHTIRGRGGIRAALVNDGLVSSDVPGEFLQLITNNMANNGTFEAVNGAVMQINNIGVTQGPGAEIRADGAGSVLDLVGAAIDGGDLVTTGGGRVAIASGNAAFNSVGFSGVMDLSVFRAISLTGTFTNNGAITVNPEGSSSSAFFDVNETMTIGGTGTITLNSTVGGALIRTPDDVTVTMGPDQVIHGRGGIQAALVNNGVISADVPAAIIQLITRDKTNNNLIEAVGGATVEVNNIVLTQDPGATLIADGADSTINLIGAAIDGGDLTTTNGGRVTIASGNAAFNNVDFSGVMDLSVFRLLSLTGTFTNNGAITVNPQGSASTAFLDVNETMTIGGAGSITLNSTVGGALVRTAEGVTVTMGPDQVIHGRGGIQGAVVNNGLISADVDGQTIQLITRDKTNNSRIEAVNGGDLQINAVTVSQPGAGEIVIDGADSTLSLFSNATVTGGDVSMTNGGRGFVLSGNATLDGVTLEGPLDVEVFRALFIRNGLENNGDITVNFNGSGSSAFMTIFGTDTPITGTGRIFLNSGGVGSLLTPGDATSSVVLGSGQTLEGRGQIRIPTTTSGTVQPGNAGVGTMSATQPVAFTADATFDVEVADDIPGQADLFTSTSTLDLDGTLRVAFVEGFAPSAEWVQTVMTAPSIEGKFQVVDAPAAPSGLVVRSFNTGTEVRVGWVCPGDADVDGMINILDVVNFINAWSAMDPDTDFNNDGQLNILDVVAFISAWSAACG